MILLHVLACASPFAPVARRERPWWEGAAALERAEGLDLVELPGGEPLGYWPRIVVRTDRIEVDDRAWFLGLPAEELADAAAAGALVEGEVLALRDGVLPGPDEGYVVAPLLDRLNPLMDAMRAWDPDRAGAEIVVVAEPSVPGRTLMRVLYTAGQAGFGAFVVAGAAEGRVRAAYAGAAWCPTSLTLAVGAAGDLALPYGPSLLPPGGRCPASPVEAARAVDALHRACGPAWDRLAARSPEHAAEEGWRCVEVVPLIGDADAGGVLEVLGALEQSDRDVRVAALGTTPSGTAPAPACAEAVAIDALDRAMLDVVCAGDDVRRWPSTGWRGRWAMEALVGGPDEVRAAFPAWSAAHPPPPPPEGWGDGAADELARRSALLRALGGD